MNIGINNKRLRRMALVPLVLVGVGTLATGPAGAGPTVKAVTGHMDVELSSSSTCGSPLGLCMTGTFRGSLQGTVELAAQAIAPTADPNVVVVNSTAVLHAKKGDVFFSNSAVWDNSSTGGGIESSIDRITGGTGEYAGASGYLQTIGRAVTGSATAADYWGQLRLP